MTGGGGMPKMSQSKMQQMGGKGNLKPNAKKMANGKKSAGGGKATGKKKSY